MTTIVFGFDRDPSTVCAVLGGDRIQRIVPEPFDAAVPVPSLCVSFNSSGAILAPSANDVVTTSQRCTIRELLDGTAPVKPTAGTEDWTNRKLLAAVLRRYLATATASGLNPELAVLLVPDEIGEERSRELVVAGLFAGFTDCAIVTRATALQELCRAHVKNGEAALVVHADADGAYGTVLTQESSPTTVALTSVLGPTALSDRFHEHAAAMFPTQASEAAFESELGERLSVDWCDAAEAAPIVWSDVDRAPVFVPASNLQRRLIDAKIGSELFTVLDENGVRDREMALVYCTGRVAVGLGRLVQPAFPHTRVQVDPEAFSLMRAGVDVATSRPASRIESRVIIGKKAPRGFPAAPEQVDLANINGRRQAVRERLQASANTSLSLVIESGGKQQTVCDLPVRELDRRRGWTHFAIRVISDTRSFFACELAVGRRGIYELVILDRENEHVYRLTPTETRLIYAA
jgi:hypothetical protein